MDISLKEDTRIVNLDRFRRDISPLLVRDNLKQKQFYLNIPSIERSNSFQLNGFKSLISEVLKQSKHLPHSKIALTYKENNSSIIIEVQPVTDAA